MKKRKVILMLSPLLQTSLVTLHLRRWVLTPGYYATSESSVCPKAQDTKMHTKSIAAKFEGPEIWITEPEVCTDVRNVHLKLNLTLELTPRYVTARLQLPVP